MTDQILKRKGGRPPLPPAPQTAAACRSLIASETVKAKPRDRTLRYLYRLLKAFEAGVGAAPDFPPYQAAGSMNLCAEGGSTGKTRTPRRFVRKSNPHCSKTKSRLANPIRK